MQKLILPILALVLTSCVHLSAQKSSGALPSIKFYDQTILEDEIPAWVEVKKSLPAYLEFWKYYGASPAALPIAVVIEPYPSMKKSEAIETMYGSDFFSDLQILQGDVGKVQSAAELSVLLQKFSCRYPPVFGNLSFKYLKSPLGIAKLKVDMNRQIQKLLAPDGNINGLTTTSAYYAKYAEGGCQVVVLGRSDDTAIKQHPFLQRDILFHELGHSFQLSLWGLNSSEKIVSSESRPFEEAIADMFAHVYLEDPCHDRLPHDESRIDQSTQCGRNLEKQTLPVWDHVWSSKSSHENNDAFRHFLWLVFKEKTWKKFAKTFVAELSKIQISPKPSDKLDAFTREYHRITRDSRLMVGMMNAICADKSIEACKRLEDFTGLEPVVALKGLLDNSPTAIGTAARKVAVDGKTYEVQFVSMPGKSGMYLSIKGQGKSLQVKPNGVTLESDYKIVWANYSSDGANVSWGSNGQLKIDTFKATLSSQDQGTLY